MFDEHGAFNVNTSGQVLIIELKDEFNELIAHRVIADTEACIDQLDGQPFGILLIISNFGLGTPESDEIVKYSEIHFQSRGLTHSAVIYKIDAQRFQVENNIIAHPEVTRFITKNMDDGLSFLNDAGYKITKDEVEAMGYSINP